jgi:hypothetical protein
VLTLLAGAIMRVADPRYIDIDCAYNDAYRVYDTLARVSGSRFDHRRSAVFCDPAASEFLELVSSVAMALSVEDQLVVYFSGHADQHEGMARLLFTDADIRGRGRLRVDVLAAPLVDSSTRSILVLDCCNSGNALTVADTRDALLPRRISVVASSGAYQPSKFGPEESAFTSAFCRALDDLSEQGRPLTLSAIAECVEGDEGFKRRIHVNHRSGFAEDSIEHDPVDTGVPIDAAQRFTRALGASDRRTREALWYSLAEMPIAVQVAALNKVCTPTWPAEPSWVVRRAIGSILGELPSHSRNRRSLILSLTAEDRLWMHRAAGIIAARRDLARDERLRRMTAEMIVSSPVADLKWLAHLYVADVDPPAALAAALKSTLVSTGWGLVDVFRRHASSYASDLSVLLRKLRDAADDDPTRLRYLKDHIRLAGIPDHGLEGVPSCEELVHSGPARLLYSRRARGTLRLPRAKWLMSILYGSWRDQVEANALSVLDQVPDSRRAEEARILAELPPVELRMVLAHEASAAPEMTEDIAAVFHWSAQDPHPWVRRKSLSSEGPDGSNLAFADTIDRVLYPGVLDLVIRGAELGIVPGGYVGGLDLSKQEREALKAYGACG